MGGHTSKQVTWEMGGHTSKQVTWEMGRHTSKQTDIQINMRLTDRLNLVTQG